MIAKDFKELRVQFASQQSEQRGLSMPSNAVATSVEHISAHYLNEIRKFPMLSFEEEQALAAAGAMSRTSKRSTLRAALQELRVTLEDDEFDAAEATRNFVIVANNHAARAVIPALTRRVAKLAPSVVLDVRPMGMQHVLDQLDGGSVELALTTLAEGGRPI